MSNDSKVTTLETPATDAAVSTKVAGKKIAANQSGHDAALSGKTLEINIFASEKEHGSDAVEVGLNGVMYKIPRGDYYPVPEEVVAILNNAVTAVTTPAPGGAGVITRDVPRFNFQTR